ncbi:MAG: hypothetical protein QW562_05960 [Thermosphaera sp.]
MMRNPQRTKSMIRPLVTSSIILVLFFAGMVGLVEKGPPSYSLPVGASPLNPGNLGTSELYGIIRSKYSYTMIARSVDEVYFGETPGRCLLIVISPEKPYSPSESRLLMERMSMCEEPAMIVADEYTSSNNILTYVGVSIAGRIYVKASDGLPYLNASFIVDGGNVNLLLDIASSVQGGQRVLGYAENVVPIDDRSSPPLNITVASYSEARIPRYDGYGAVNLKAIVLSDGSIFLNQVLRSDRGPEYVKVVMGYVDMLCESAPDCRIVIEASKYEEVSSSEMLRDPQVLLRTASTDWMLTATLLGVVLLHPSTWFTPFLSYTGELFLSIVNDRHAGIPLIALVSALVYLYTSRRIPGKRDERLPEQVEREIYATHGVRERVLRGRYDLSRNDFTALYSIVDTYMLELLGVSLKQPEAVEALSRFVGRDSAEKYVRKMNKLYEKATLGRKLPLVFSWGRVVKQMLRDTEALLNKLGASLSDEKGYEYLEMRRA